MTVTASSKQFTTQEMHYVIGSGDIDGDFYIKSQTGELYARYFPELFFLCFGNVS